MSDRHDRMKPRSDHVHDQDARDDDGDAGAVHRGAHRLRSGPFEDLRQQRRQRPEGAHQGPGHADVTEGSGGVWERLSYDWTDPNHVVARTTDSNIWGGRSGHTYRFTRNADGTTEIDYVVVREGKNFKGKFLGVVLGSVGKSKLVKAFQQQRQGRRSAGLPREGAAVMRLVRNVAAGAAGRRRRHGGDGPLAVRALPARRRQGGPRALGVRGRRHELGRGLRARAARTQGVATWSRATNRPRSGLGPRRTSSTGRPASVGAWRTARWRAPRRASPGRARSRWVRSAWLSGYVVLPLAKVYKPIWEYDARTLADDLSAHLVYGAAASAVFAALTERT